MMRKYLLPILALIGLLLAVTMVLIGNRQPAIDQPAVLSPKSPFATYVAGAGIVEASTGNIIVGSPVSGIVVELYVNEGSQVDVGDKLFKIDDREQRAQLIPAAAKVTEIAAHLAQAKSQFELANSLSDKRAISVEELNNRRFAVKLAEAELVSAQAQVKQIQMDIERHTVRALVRGRILQNKMRIGAFVQDGAPSDSSMLLGNDARLFVRADIDENDAWRVQPGARAVAFVRGNPKLQTALKFERVDPYVLPKTSLTGDSAERVDTRALQVIYSFDHTALPIYVGQQVDVFIETEVSKSSKGQFPQSTSTPSSVKIP
ncbi:HlyD family efflux transporter periplasmic adaptor subunit [Acinetobacter sp. ANC 4910]|uniref:efflux RND transporter periplasmic adaptor subunit n=1 Tax=Acinetobacter sp. ANC 4910 TaxID=2529850 RepID=UPI00103F497F|nr:HlyD family efflux transporter periplasmic adaptor subunit [Acinetobacter sp. ANC 4910]TCB35207.1 HlyD family efflux transporter periplasmic adaptor subunit [Acinetobacter sp. ANC 4910]